MWVYTLLKIISTTSPSSYLTFHTNAHGTGEGCRVEVVVYRNTIALAVLVQCTDAHRGAAFCVKVYKFCLLRKLDLHNRKYYDELEFVKR